MPAGSEEDPKDVVLLEQPYLKDESMTIGELVRDTIAKTGENIRIRRFARFELGQIAASVRHRRSRRNAAPQRGGVLLDWGNEGDTLAERSLPINASS